MMTEQPINIIRESTRNLLKLNRRLQRDKECNIHREIEDKSITPKDIEDIANKLKTKSAMSVKELQTLKNALINDQCYIGLVLNVHGALRGIIRELTGQNEKKKIAAAGCCCNLALGDSKACTAIAKDVGAYLTAELDSLTNELAVISAWTLGNLAGSGPKVCDILVRQGALAKLSHLHNNEDLQDAALYALIHFTYQMKDELSEDYFVRILNMATQLNMTVALGQLIFILSCSDYFPKNLTENLKHKLLEELPPSLESHLRCPKEKVCCKLLYILRILANMSNFCYSDIANVVLNNRIVVRNIINLNDITVNNSLYWLLGNINNFDNNFACQFLM